MRILGLDPSLSCTGWAIIEEGKVLESGTIKTKPKQSFIQRLETIWFDIEKVFGLTKDFDYVAIEEIFVYQKKSLQTPLKIAKVHGVILGVLFEHRYEAVIKYYAPTLVKQTVTGSGKASKEQVLKMVQLQTGYKGKQLDISDAIAVALTCERDIKT